jgi:hypothetical protein
MYHDTRKQRLFSLRSLVFCIYLLDHTLECNLFESVIPTGFAIDERKSFFIEAHTITPALSQLIRISQMLVA